MTMGKRINELCSSLRNRQSSLSWYFVRWRHCVEYQFCTVSDRMAPMATEGCPFYGLLQLSVGLLSLILLQPFCPAELATDIVFFHGFTLGCFVTLGKKMAFDGGFKKKNDNKTKATLLVCCGMLCNQYRTCLLQTNPKEFKDIVGQVQCQSRCEVIFPN